MRVKAIREVQKRALWVRPPEHITVGLLLVLNGFLGCTLLNLT